MAVDEEIRREARRESPGSAFLFDDNENRMIEIIVRVPAVEVDAADLAQDRGLVRNAPVLDVSRLIGAKAVGSETRRKRRQRQSRIVARVEQIELSRQQLPRVIDAEIEPRFEIVREAIAEIAVELRVVRRRMFSVVVGMGERAVDEKIEIADDARHLRLPAHGSIAAALERHHVRRERRIGGRRDEIDRAAERRGAIGEGVAAFHNFDRAKIFGIDLIHVAAAVGVIHRNAVLQQLQSAQMEVARQI